MTLETHLRTAGRPLLVPYVTGGITADWTDYLVACQEAGADAIEVGLPFSDPMLDGVTIQQASDRALARGVTPESILDDLSRTTLRVPIIVMTYANLVLRHGIARLAAAGVSGLIVPDLPLDESAVLEAEAAAAGVDLVLLVAPSTPGDRLREICERSRGFVYAISVMGTTGERETLAASAATLAARVKAVTDRPVLLGFGISTPEQAAEAGRAGDGAVVGAALMRRVLDGATPADLGRAVAELRAALDLGVSPGTPHAEVSGHRG
ncbi:tryptophan synthase subunit alpha [Actinoplanes friuliensis]|jgi:tryptophan synthase alpha chain|uniref:Tryptophan synthase alpha chain n=1 Tax=Actinoplanes friuliensis DSM 7358 TaxID=1246995 RepID=U5VZA5_9ACTN|nr:tryptophan synthase subunit alpha [Actinoplanes friuliensis]AGZ42323.1 tryptophan synthase [Actinoplanes friuliensis DSM 7358]